MAEIETKRSAAKKKRFNKKSTRVDLTPMVDLGFLLITFFVFTTRLAEPKSMNLVMPYNKVPPGDKICESCVLTVLLDKDNRIKYYEGTVENNPSVKETGYAASEIREVLMQKKQPFKNFGEAATSLYSLLNPLPPAILRILWILPMK